MTMFTDMLTAILLELAFGLACALVFAFLTWREDRERKAAEPYYGFVYFMEWSRFHTWPDTGVWYDDEYRKDDYTRVAY